MAGHCLTAKGLECTQKIWINPNFIQILETSVSTKRNRVTTDDAKLAANPAGLSRFFQKVDWVSFGVTTLLTLAVYLFTLSPEVDLDYSGFYSTAAMYPGVSISPGHPLWA